MINVMLAFVTPCLSQNDTITIIGVGDMMLGTNYPSARYLPPNDGKDLLVVVGRLRAGEATPRHVVVDPVGFLVPRPQIDEDRVAGGERVRVGGRRLEVRRTKMAWRLSP